MGPDDGTRNRNKWSEYLLEGSLVRTKCQVRQEENEITF